MNVRLDKFLAGLGLVSRRNVGSFIRGGHILVDGELATKSDMKLTYGQIISFDEKDIEVKETIYVRLYKTGGYVCSELDEGGHLSYKILLQDCPYASMLHVAGRLDQDTEGLVLCSNDGQFTHSIISPKKHLEKEYHVRTKLPVTQDQLDRLEDGVTLDDGYHTMPAKAEKIDDFSLALTIVEGKFHQVKRMLEAVGNEVTYLRRDRIGDRILDGIQPGKRDYFQPKSG